MKIIILIDNTSDPSSTLKAEHGLSIYFEINSMKYLLDVGASGKFAENAATLGIDIAEIDLTILSHAHRDHTGGLAEFLRLNNKAKIYLSSHIPGNRYFSTRRGAKRDISADNVLFEKYPERFLKVDQDLQITPEIRLISHIPQRFDRPAGNRTLLTNDLPDDFRHEIAIHIDTPKGNLLLSSCSHHGVLNTLAAGGNKQTIAYIGGTHLIDSDAENQYESDEQLKNMAKEIATAYPVLTLYTGHCTGLNAQNIFSEILKERFTAFYSGFELEI